jgi:hypothetical protein
MWPHVYVICVCLVFLSVGDMLVNSAGEIVTAQSTAEDPLKMVVKKDRNM